MNERSFIRRGMKSREDKPRSRQELRREELHAKASEVFAARGFAATRISDIARAAGISQGLLYRYFPSKDALYVEIVGASFAKLNEAAEGLEKAPLPPRRKIEMALEGLLSGIERDAVFSNRVLLIAQSSISEGVPGKIGEILKAESSKPYQVIERILKEGQRDGSILPGNSRDLAVLFWTTVKGLALHRVAVGETFRAPELGLVTRLFFAENKLEKKTL